MGHYNVQARLEAGIRNRGIALACLEEAHGSLDARHTCRVRVESNILHDLGGEDTSAARALSRVSTESQTQESTASKPTFASSLLRFFVSLGSADCRTAERLAAR